MTLFKKIQWFCNLIRLRSYYKFLLLIAYTAFGAWLFRTYELQADIKRRSVFGNSTSLVRRQLAERWIEMHKDAVLRNDTALRHRRAAEAVEWLLDELNLSDHIRDLSEETPWTWTGAMFYAGQLYTTIGYGYPTTKTDEGRICTIFYALFGIPCFLMYLKSIGKLLSKKMRKYYKQIRRSQLGKILLPTRVTAMSDGLPDEAAAAEERKKKPFPIPIAIIMLIVWICFSASMFCIWEETWVFSSAVYFFIVSISTVGLGDMLFRTPDMMVFNFLLILVGLALLSMCFELITDRVAKWKQKRFDEHIKKVQKMAFQVFEKDPFVEEAPPLGIRMAPNLMSLAATHVSEEKRGFFAEFKDWFAGKVTDNVIQSKLEDSDDESEEEVEEMAEEFETHPIATVAGNDLVVCTNGGATRRVSKQSYALSDVSNISKGANPESNYGRLLDRIKAMEKFKPKKNDLESRMFAKFLENKKLVKILEQTELRELATVSCQTDLSGMVVQRRHTRGNHTRIGSVSSQSTMASFLNPNRHAPDDDSVMSITFGDLKFDYKTEPLIDEYHIRESNHSIFDFDDDDIVKVPQKMLVSRPGMPPPPPSRPSKLASPLRALLEKEQKYDNDMEILMTPRRLASLGDIQARKVKIGYDENLQHARLVCGLLPQDFDSPSTSTSTSMIDSGYDLSKRDAPLHIV